ncbi:MAG: 3-oxoacyl-[acyl-carrier-protein] reductase [Spirochaetota bacterium]|nr:MAG: 3-oxoacyl-[acyl-carrier-protein] reductase [Spirochaetota bacterium]
MLKDKVAFITGAAQGIGKEIARVYGENGARLVICDINESILNKTVSELKSKSVEAIGFKLDVSKLDECTEASKKAVDKYERIDILVNNAGITRDNLLIRMTEEEFDRVISVNLRGVFNCTKAISRIMLRQRYGRIVNIASIVGIVGSVGQVNYSASKAGVIAITKSVARELAAKNITANAIAPGYIKTEMTDILPDDVKQTMVENIPLKREGLPLDIAHTALFLASDLASYITGQVIVVDGGMVM